MRLAIPGRTVRHTPRAMSALCPPVLALLACLLAAPVAMAQVAQPITAAPGQVHGSVLMGTVRIDGDRTSTMDASLRIGVSRRMEIAAPLAMAVSILQTPKGSGMSLAAGVSDMWVNRRHQVLWTPGFAVAAKYRAAHTAALFAAVDWMWLPTDWQLHQSPTYLRGAVSLMVEMGPYLTWTFGVAYQRMVTEGDLPEALHRSGLAGNARVSLFSVRATSFEELPILAARLTAHLDVIFSYRLDIDTDTDTLDQRFLAGIRLHPKAPR